MPEGFSGIIETEATRSGVWDYEDSLEFARLEMNRYSQELLGKCQEIGAVPMDDEVSE